MDLTDVFGQAVRHHRKLLGLSQEELAFRSGLDRTYISGVERGVRNPTLEVMQRIADGVGVDLAVLFCTARDMKSVVKAKR